MSSIPPPGLQDEINALNCALMTLRGEGGGFSPDEKQKAIDTLQRLFNDRVKE